MLNRSKRKASCFIDMSSLLTDKKEFMLRVLFG